jgi:hypothetical protein
VFLSEEFKAHQQFLSRPGKDFFMFTNAKSKAASAASGIMPLLEKNWVTRGLFECANKFQRESVKK